MKKFTIILLLLTTELLATSAQHVLNLGGMWDFAVGDETVREKGAMVNVQPRRHYDDAVELPGSTITNVKKIPESGVAWYRKKVYVPKDWKGQRITLFLERPYIATTVYVNGREVGHQMSISTPHRYDLSGRIKAGKQNEIAVRVCNRIGDVADQSQGNWNGIAGLIELQAQWKKLNIRHVNIETANDLNSYKVEVKLENNFFPVRIMPFYDYDIELKLKDRDEGTILQSKTDPADWKNNKVFNMSTSCRWVEGKTRQRLVSWDEFHPKLYRLTITAGDDTYETAFGLCSIDTKGGGVRTNDRPLFLRGAVENCCFPETGYPPMDKDSWLQILRKYKDWGLNLVRFHNYCPPEAAFQAADEVGIYLLPEVPSWIGEGNGMEQYAKDESQRIVDTYGHHPSLCLFQASLKKDGQDLLASIEEFPPGLPHPKALHDFFGQGDMAPMDSVRMQMLYYKYEMERNMCTSDYAGFMLPSLNDCSRDGTALVGPLDAQWKEKDNVTSREWREFCNALVVLARFPHFTYTTADTLRVPIEMMNAIYGDLQSCATTWKVLQNDSVLYQSGTFPSKDIPIGKGTQLGTVVLPLDGIKAPAKMTLRVVVEKSVVNHWDFWVYDTPNAQGSLSARYREE